jgi:CheY-like chemotaxis protein
MSRILLVDDSPHAQRMGERILSEEGFEVVTVSNADAALIRMEDVDPDVVLADTVMPGRTGYDICQYIKLSPRHKHVRVILTAGVLETLDEAHCKRVEADTTLRKPFEATALLAAVRPLAEAAENDRKPTEGKSATQSAAPAAPRHVAPFIAVVDSEQVRAAVTVALDAAMESMVEEITRRVLATLNKKKPDARTLDSVAAAAAPATSAPVPLPPPEPAGGRLKHAPPELQQAVSDLPQTAPEPMPRAEAVRRVSPLRLRSSSILGLDIYRSDPPSLPEEGQDETPPPEE